jgi:hypothetical protein
MHVQATKCEARRKTTRGASMSEIRPKLGRPRKKQGTKPTTVSLSTSTRLRLQQLAKVAFNGNMTLCVEKMIEWVPNDFHQRKREISELPEC